MKIVITSKKPIKDDVKGRLPLGTVIDLPEHKAMFYIERGEAVRYETKLLEDNPLKTDGVEAQLSVSPVAEASQNKILNLSKSGEKKKLATKKR